MEMRDLRSFVVLAEQLHFGRAAQLLHISQPALTKQIRRLEEEWGGALFERGRHGTRLGAAGAGLLEETREVLRGFERLVAAGKQGAAGERGRLRIGFGFHTFDLVPRVVVELRKKSPALQISLKDMSTAEQTQALAAEEIDAGFVRLPVARAFETFPVTIDRVALVSGASSGLPRAAGLAECRERPFVLLAQKRSPGFHRHVLKLCARAGFHPRIVQEAPEITTVLALVRAGLGVAFIPESFGGNRFPGIRVHRLPGKEAEWAVGVAWRRGDSNPVLGRFLDLIRGLTIRRGGSIPAPRTRGLR
jgi:DNA-binding transcriptional LysR family regulator